MSSDYITHTQYTPLYFSCKKHTSIYIIIMNPMFDAPHLYYVIFFFLKKDPNIDTRFIYAVRIIRRYIMNIIRRWWCSFTSNRGGKKIINELFIDESSRSFSAHNIRCTAIAVDLRRDTERKKKERIGKSLITEILCLIIYG